MKIFIIYKNNTAEIYDGNINKRRHRILTDVSGVNFDNNNSGIFKRGFKNYILMFYLIVEITF